MAVRSIMPSCERSCFNLECTTKQHGLPRSPKPTKPRHKTLTVSAALVLARHAPEVVALGRSLQQEAPIPKSALLFVKVRLDPYKSAASTVNPGKLEHEFRMINAGIPYTLP